MLYPSSTSGQATACGTLCSKEQFIDSFGDPGDLNPFITHGYRPKSSLLECVQSVVKIHNESINIWSHLPPSLICACVVAVQDCPVLALYTFASSLCLFSSSVYHTLNSHTISTRKTCSKCDWASIIVLMLASDIPLIHFAFMYSPPLQFVYTTLVSACAAATCAIITKNSLYSNTAARNLAFCALVSTSFVHITHAHFSSPNCQIPSISAASLSVYSVGFCFFVSKFPERAYPGQLNIAINSHQIWHMFVVAGILVHMRSVNWLCTAASHCGSK